MKLTNLKPASDFEVRKWLEKSLELTPYQKDILNNRELIRLSRFYFYERRKTNKISFLFRLTIFFVPVYLLMLLIALPFHWVFTNRWGFGQKYYDNFHAKWLNKLGLKS
jgi:hypothetical protein